MSHSPQEKVGSKQYLDGWHAINVLIRSDGSWSGRERNTFYLNEGQGKFSDGSFVSGLDFPGDGRSFVSLDIDRDGNLDLVLKFRTAPGIRILRNEWSDVVGADGRGSLVLELVGTETNRDGVGARVTLQTDQRKLTGEVHSGSGFLSQSSRRVHFGLLDKESTQALEVRWPSGRVQRITKVPSHGLFRIAEGVSRVVSLTEPKPQPVEPEPVVSLAQTPGTWLLAPVPAPDFSLESVEGKNHRLSEYRGQKVLLNFWATWCPPCREELSDLAANIVNLRASDVAVVAVSVDEPTEHDRVREFATKHGLTFPIVYADDQVVAAYTILNRHLFDRRRDLAIPTSFLIDEQGRIVKVYKGVTPASVILADADAQQRPAFPFRGKWHRPPSGRSYVEMATEMAERGLPNEARTLFEAAVSEKQTNYELYNNYAGVLLEAGEFARAQELLRESLELNPYQVDARVNLGVLLQRLGKLGEAVELLEAAQKMQPDDAFVLNALGSAHFAVGHFDEAEQSYRQAIHFEPDSADYHYNLGAVLAKKGRAEQALAAFEQSGRLGRDTLDLANSLGVLYMQKGQPQRALTQLQHAVEIDPSHYGSHMNLATYYLQIKDLSKGRAWIEKAKSLDPQNPSAYLLEAQILISLGNTVEARGVLEKVLQTHPNLQQAVELLNKIR